MSQPAFQLTFPCPGCGHPLTLHHTPATGPCPHCGQSLSAIFEVKLTEPDSTSSDFRKSFHNRSFKPDTRPAPTPQKTFTPGTP